MNYRFFPFFASPAPMEKSQLQVEDLVIQLSRKPVKHLRLTIHRFKREIRLTAPRRLSETAIRCFVLERLPWIRRHWQTLPTQTETQTPQYLSGEKLLFRGTLHTLQVIEQSGKPRIGCLSGNVLEMRVGPGHTPTQRAKLLDQWYRGQIKSILPPLITAWESILAVKVADWGIKRMRTRWGTCNTRARRIWLNLELIKSSPACLEYVVVHEMVHLLERGHNPRFYAHLDRVLPGWKSLRKELNAQLLP